MICRLRSRPWLTMPIRPEADALVAMTRACALADLMRVQGVVVSIDQAVACARALETSGEGRVDRYWAGRVTLVADPRGMAAYEAAFARLEDAPRHHDDQATASAVSTSPRGVDTAGGATDHDDALVTGHRASAVDRLRHRRFDEATAEELEAILRAIDRLAVHAPTRPGRRRAPHRIGRIDLHRTITAALRTDAEIVRLLHRQRQPRPVPIVLLLDVSGSMAASARILLHLAVAWRRAMLGQPRSRVEVFAFATRLARLSPSLAARNVDAAIAEAADTVATWDGGTTVGVCVDELVRVWGRRGMLAGAHVVIVSDGLDRGDPRILERAMRRLQAAARQVIWASPLAGDPAYQPIQRGMAVAMPHVDRMMPLHDLASLETLVAAVTIPMSTTRVSAIAKPVRRASR